MAKEDKIQITPRISVTMKKRLDEACVEDKCSQGDVIESALKDYFEPKALEETQLGLMLRLLTEIRECQIQNIREEARRVLDGAHVFDVEAPPLAIPSPEPRPAVPVASTADIYTANGNEPWAPSLPESAYPEEPAAEVPEKRGMLKRFLFTGPK